jgi:hypothetical protein
MLLYFSVMKNKDSINLLDQNTTDYLSGKPLNLMRRAQMGSKITADKYIDTKAVFKEELSEKGKRLSKYILVGTSALTTSIEFLPGAWEGLVSLVGVTALQQIGTTATWPELAATSIATGVSTGAFTGAEQVLAAILMSNTVRRFPKTFKHIDENKTRPTTEKDKEKASNATGVLLGAPVAVMEQNLRDPNRDLKKDLKLSASMSGKVFMFNALLVSLLAGGIQTFDKIGMETISSGLENIAKNPAIFVALFGLIKLRQSLKEDKEYERNQLVSLVNSPLPTN